MNEIKGGRRRMRRRRRSRRRRKSRRSRRRRRMRRRKAKESINYAKQKHEKDADNAHC